jgi:hypothetical protein
MKADRKTLWEWLGWEGLGVIAVVIVLVGLVVGWIMISAGIRDGMREGIETFASRPWWANLPIFGWFWSAEDEVAVQSEETAT